MSETNLVLSRGGFPPFSARNCTQSLSPIHAGQLKRTIDGRLLYLNLPHSAKYRSTITGHDKTPAAFDGLWRGDMLKVDCMQRLCQEMTVTANGDEFTLSRPYVPESLCFLNQQGEDIETPTLRDLTLICHDSHVGQKIYASFRPILTMRVEHFSCITNEQDLSSRWQLDLQED